MLVRLQKWLLFSLGLFVMSYGIILLLEAELGMASWNILEVGLYQQFGFTIGIWSLIISAAVILLNIFVTRKIPGWGMIMNMILVGVFMDIIIFLHLVPNVSGLVLQIVYFIIGFIFLTFGIGMYISPLLGEGPRDGLTLNLSRRSGFSIRQVRTSMELVVLAIGWLLGGPVGIGTIIITLFMGFLIQYFIELWKGWLGRLRT